MNKLLISVACVLVAAMAYGSAPLGFWRPASSAAVAFLPTDDFESYTDAASVNGLNGGSGFSAAYVDRAGLTGDQATDDMENYTDAASVNGLNGGTGFSGAYVDRDGLFGVQASDDMESYTDAAALNGLNGGTGWTGPFVDR